MTQGERADRVLLQLDQLERQVASLRTEITTLLAVDGVTEDVTGDAAASSVTRVVPVPPAAVPTAAGAATAGATTASWSAAVGSPGDSAPSGSDVILPGAAAAAGEISRRRIAAGARPATGSRPRTQPLVAPFWRRPGFVPAALAVLGTAITLAGIAFLLVLAAYAGLFGPVPRVSLAAVVAVALVAIGHRLHARRPGAGPIGLVATGCAIAFLDIVAVTSIYGWVPPVAGVLLAAVVAAAALVIAARWRSELLAVLAVLGTALLILHLTGDEWAPRPATLGFFLALSAATAPVSLRRPWPVLELARLVPSSLVVLMGAASLYSEDPLELRMAVLVAAAVLAALGLLGALVRSPEPPVTTTDSDEATTPARVSTGPTTNDLRWGGLVQPGLILLTAVPLALSTHLAEKAWTSVIPLLALGAYAAATVVLARRAGGRRTLSSWATALCAGVFTNILITACVSDQWMAVGLLIAVCLALGVAIRTGSPLSLPAAGLNGLIAAGLVLDHVGSYLLLRRAGSIDVAAVPEWLLLGVACYLAVPALQSTGAFRMVASDTVPRFVLLAGVVMSGTGVIVAQGVLIGRTVNDEIGGFFTGHTVATLAWFALAVVLLTNRRIEDARWTRAALVLLVAAVAKLLLFDLSTLPGMLRVAAFTLSGLAILAAGVRYRERGVRPRLSAEGEPDTSTELTGPGSPGGERPAGS